MYHLPSQTQIWQCYGHELALDCHIFLRMQIATHLFGNVLIFSLFFVFCIDSTYSYSIISCRVKAILLDATADISTFSLSQQSINYRLLSVNFMYSGRIHHLSSFTKICTDISLHETWIPFYIGYIDDYSAERGRCGIFRYLRFSISSFTILYIIWPCQ